VGHLIPPQPLDVVQWVTVRLHADGSVSTAGTIGDKKMAKRLLDIAQDAIKTQVADYKAIAVPNHEIDVAPNLPVRDLGYMLERERGDP
jgi:hypothetical protein